MHSAHTDTRGVAFTDGHEHEHCRQHGLVLRTRPKRAMDIGPAGSSQSWRPRGSQRSLHLDPHLAPDRFLCELGGYRAGPLQQTRPICGTAWAPHEVLATLDKHLFTTGEFYDDGGILIAFSFELHERIRCDCTGHIPSLVVHTQSAKPLGSMYCFARCPSDYISRRRHPFLRGENLTALAPQCRCLVCELR